MDIYLLKADDRYQWLLPANNRDWDKFSLFDGRSLASAWSPVRVMPDPEDFSDSPLSDFPGLASCVPVFSKNAVNVLSGILKEEGELLPLTCAEGTYFAYNVTRVVDALDIARSECVHFSSGRIMVVKRYVFHTEKLASFDIFKVPQTSPMDVFVTSHFVELATRAGLTGFLFKQTG